MKTLISAEALHVCINKQTILENVNFALAEGSVTSVIGPSGSGKSTLLKSIAGFIKPCSGEIKIARQTVASKKINVPPEQRQIGVVFQDAPLFQHMTVEENIKVAMKRSPELQKQAGRYVNQLLDMMQLEHLQYRYTHELSGGQQQRVALARSLAMNTKIMLLDEPFANLNEDLHMQIAEAIFGWFYDHGTTVMLVTHDQYDAMAISDNVLVLMDGTSVQQDRSDVLFDKPKNKSIARFVHRGSLIPAKLKPQSPLCELSVGIRIHRVKKSHTSLDASAIKPNASKEKAALQQSDCIVETPFGIVRAKNEHQFSNKNNQQQAYVWVQPEDFIVVCVNEEQGGCFGVDHLAQGEISRVIWRTTDILLHVNFPEITQEDGTHNVLVKVSQGGEYHRSQPFDVGQKVVLTLKDHRYNVYF